MSFLNFHEQPNPGKKTKVWEVLSSSTGTVLGTIGWMAHWRKYTFGPMGGMIFDPNCLREISDFMEDHTREHMGWD